MSEPRGSGEVRSRRIHCGALLLAAVAPWASGDGLAADVAAGRKKAVACIACHGESGMSTVPNAPHLAGQPALYLADQLRQFRSGRRASEVMAVIAKPLSDQDVDDLAAWYEAIRIEAKPPP
jgi:cytochrome c553